MILSHLRKTGNDQQDPKVKKRLLRIEGGLSRAQLNDLSRNDPAPEVRIAATNKIDDPDELQYVIENDPDKTARENACNRLTDLLTGETDVGLPFTVRMEKVTPSLHQKVIEQIATRANESELRLMAIKLISKNSVLGDIVINTGAKETKLAALEKISQASTLERTIKMLRKSANSDDEEVLRLAEDRLKALVLQSGSPDKINARCEQLCLSVEALTNNIGSQETDEKYALCRDQWTLLQGSCNAQLETRFDTVCRAFEAEKSLYLLKEQEKAALENTHAEYRQQKNRLCKEAEELDSPLNHPDLSLDEKYPADLEEKISSLKNRWEKIGQLQETEQRHFNSRFTTAINRLASNKKQHLKNIAAITKSKEILSKAEALLSSDKDITKQSINELKTEWRGLGSISHTEILQTVSTEFERNIQALENGLKSRSEAKKHSTEVISQLLDDIDFSLKNGQLKSGIALLQQCRDLMSEANTLPSKKKQQFETRLNKASAKVNELQSWKRWGGAQERERLCTEMETLINSDTDPRELHKQIKKLDTAWKKTGPTENEAANQLRKRFYKAYKKAGKPCREFFANQARERQNNLQKKEHICETLESFCNNEKGITDTKQANKLWRNTPGDWGKIGSVPREETNKITQRYQSAMSQLKQQLETIWEQNSIAKTHLIKRVTALHDSDNISKTVEQTKRLQSEWTTIGPLKQDMERKLWQEFRNACDVIFQSRNEQSKENKQKIREQLGFMKQLCIKAEGIPDESSGNERSALTKIKNEWAALEKPKGNDSAQLSKRFKAACATVEKKLREHQQKLLALQDQYLHDKISLCDQLEMLIDANNNSDTIEELKSRWADLPELDNTNRNNGLQKRFGLALDLAAAKADESKLAEFKSRNLIQKKRLCLQMEILAGIESPSYAKDERLSYQVELLAKTMGKGVEKITPNEQFFQIETEWYLTGIVPKDQAEKIKTRFDSAMNAFNKKAKNSK